MRRDVLRAVWPILLLALSPFLPHVQGAPPEPQTWRIYPDGRRELWSPDTSSLQLSTRQPGFGIVAEDTMTTLSRLTEVRVVDGPMPPGTSGNFPAHASATSVTRPGTGSASIFGGSAGGSEPSGVTREPPGPPALADRSYGPGRANGGFDVSARLGRASDGLGTATPETGLSPSGTQRSASLQPNALRPEAAFGEVAAADGSRLGESTIGGAQLADLQGPRSADMAGGLTPRVGPVDGRMAAAVIHPGPPNAAHPAAAPQSALTAARSPTTTVTAGGHSGDTPGWLTVGLANLLGTLTGLLVGLPIVTAASYLLLSRLGSGSLRYLNPGEGIGHPDYDDNPVHASDESTANRDLDPLEGQLHTVVADFGEDNVPFRIVGRTYDEEQQDKAERDREQTQAILRKIMEDNVALCEEVSARRAWG